MNANWPSTVERWSTTGHKTFCNFDPNDFGPKKAQTTKNVKLASEIPLVSLRFFPLFIHLGSWNALARSGRKTTTQL